MKKTILGGTMFMLGLAVGSVVTWKVTSEYYKKVNKEDIESVKQAYANKYKDAEPDVEVKKVINTEYINDTIEKAKNISKKYGYVYEENARKEETQVNSPRIIRPDEFGENDYALITLMYHTDGIVSNDRGKIVSNYSELVGEDFMNHFGEYEEDSVFVRNDEMEIDYEILKDYRAFTEIE